MPVVEEIRRFLAMALAWRTDFRAIGRNAQVALHERAHRYCCRKATDKPKPRRQLRSSQPPSHNKSFAMSLFLDYRSYIVFWPSGACPRGLRGSSEVTYPDGRRHNVRRHGCAVSWEHTGGTTFSECKPAFQSFATVRLL